MYCKTCDVSCPSDYQYREHINGRKHAAMIAGGGRKGGGGSGFCFQFQNTGRCSKGQYCTYRHVKNSYEAKVETKRTTNTFCQTIPNSEGIKRDAVADVKSSSQEIVAEYLLCKTADPLEDENEPESEPEAPRSGNQNAFSCMMRASKAESKRKNEEEARKKEARKEAESKENLYNFPAQYENALKRKQNVNLYIKNGQVIWQFGYNITVINAVKTIKGRQWNKNIDRKGSWVCPLESLPECVALYEYMGRIPDKELKDRAKKIAKLYNGGSASDAIKIVVNFSVDGATPSSENQELSFGSANFSFYYDAEVVKALKMVPPLLRNYNPETKVWTVRLLALPHALEFLGEIGYLAPPKGLKALSETLTVLDTMIHNEEGGADTPTALEPSDVKEEAHSVAPPVTAAGSAEEVKETLKKVVSILKNPKKQSGKSINRSDCGEAKKRRLTYAQKEYSRRMGGYGSDDCYDDFNEDDDYHFENDDFDNSFHEDSGYDFTDVFKIFDSSIYSSRSTRETAEQDCDCGRPWKKIGGVHACRYFGKFKCYCGNTWTSAYCWKGEGQSCRACNKESMPVTTEQLKKNGGSTLCRNTIGAHDSARCAMCKKLGYNCSSF